MLDKDLKKEMKKKLKLADNILMRVRAHTHTRTRTHTHARTRTHVRTRHTHARARASAKHTPTEFHYLPVRLLYTQTAILSLKQLTKPSYTC